MKSLLTWLFLLFAASPGAALGEVFEFHGVTLNFPGDWDFEEANDTYIATAKKDGQKIWFRAVGFPVPSDKPELDAQVWEQTQKNIDSLFAQSRRPDLVIVEVPDTPTTLPNGAVFRELIYLLKAAPEKGRLAVFTVTHRRVAILAMPGNSDHDSLLHLQVIRSILTNARWEK